jgi:NAD(P)-dependent dehydrogenase (short-subunit alcohol dehydrogenase family)
MGIWDYKGKRVAIVGCYSGMGEAAARELIALGAELHGFDVREPTMPLASYHTMDARDPASIKAAVASVEGPIDALFYCSGLPGGKFSPMDVMKVNFIGQRLTVEGFVPKMTRGGAIAVISSTAGHAYMQNLPVLKELVATPDFDAAVKWSEAHLDLVGEGYALSKQASIVYVMTQGARLIRKGIRINCICPAPTDTPMMADFEDNAPKAIIDVYARPMGRRSTPEEQARPLIFLNSDAASYVNGHVLNVDGGFVGASVTGELDLKSALTEAWTAGKA